MTIAIALSPLVTPCQLDNTVSVQQPNPGPHYLHTDLGSQYTSEDFSQALKEQEIIPSFSRKSCPYDNACIESFHAILKKEGPSRNLFVEDQFNQSA